MCIVSVFDKIEEIPFRVLRNIPLTPNQYVARLIFHLAMLSKPKASPIEHV